MRWYGAKSIKLAGWFKEFGPDYEVPEDVLGLVRKGLAEDMSKSGSPCPEFGKKFKDNDGRPLGFASIRVEHPDPGQRKIKGARFSFHAFFDEKNLGLETDDVDEAIEEYLSSIKELSTPKAPVMTLESIQERMWDLTRKPDGMTEEDIAEMSDLRRRHRELHPQKRELPKFLAGRNTTKNINKETIR